LIGIGNYFIAGETKIRLEIFVTVFTSIVGCVVNGFAGILFFTLTIFVSGKYSQIIK